MFYIMASEDQEAAYVAAVTAHNAAADPAERVCHYDAGTAIFKEVGKTIGSVAAGMLVAAGDMSLPDDGRPACGGFYLDLTT